MQFKVFALYVLSYSFIRTNMFTCISFSIYFPQRKLMIYIDARYIVYYGLSFKNISFFVIKIIITKSLHFYLFYKYKFMVAV